MNAMNGLIPAHAGKTKAPPPDWVAGPAHPRSRGENASAGVRCCFCLGSSPLTRGKPRICRTASSHMGLIPAHAGKTRSYPDQ